MVVGKCEPLVALFWLHCRSAVSMLGEGPDEATRFCSRLRTSLMLVTRSGFCCAHR